MLNHIILALELSLLLVHEMDAIKNKEWNMFLILKDMPDENAYRIFLMLHMPLYAAILFLLFSDMKLIGCYIIDLFLILHMIIHFEFRKHPANNFIRAYSNWIIYLAGILAVVHLNLL